MDVFTSSLMVMLMMNILIGLVKCQSDWSGYSTRPGQINITALSQHMPIVLQFIGTVGVIPSWFTPEYRIQPQSHEDPASFDGIHCIRGLCEHFYYLCKHIIKSPSICHNYTLRLLPLPINITANDEDCSNSYPTHWNVCVHFSDVAC